LELNINELKTEPEELKTEPEELKISLNDLNIETNIPTLCIIGSTGTGKSSTCNSLIESS
jgi:predicted GTPase